MKIFILSVLVSIVASCHSQTISSDVIQKHSGQIVSANNVKESRDETNESEEIISTSKLKCGNTDFNLKVFYKNERTNISISNSDAIVKTINLPNQSEFNGFSLNRAKKVSNGFEISVEYGSRYYYERRFNFVCKQDEFHLDKIEINTFDKNNPEKSWKNFTKLIKPKLTLEKFTITDFMKD
jgi:hypothetical protein